MTCSGEPTSRPRGLGLSAITLWGIGTNTTIVENDCFLFGRHNFSRAELRLFVSIHRPHSVVLRDSSTIPMQLVVTAVSSTHCRVCAVARVDWLLIQVCYVHVCSVCCVGNTCFFLVRARLLRQMVDRIFFSAFRRLTSCIEKCAVLICNSWLCCGLAQAMPGWTKRATCVRYRDWQGGGILSTNHQIGKPCVWLFKGHRPKSYCWKKFRES